MTSPSFIHYIQLVEAKSHTPLALEPLSYDKDQLDPAMSQQTLEYHYGQLAQGYVDRYNKGRGDPEFNRNGAKLHNLFFAQFLPYDSGNKPHGAMLDLIKKKHGTFSQFKKAVSDVAMKIQGSGWVYIDPQCDIKIIENHQYRPSMKIMLLIDWWEHAWALDYQSDKSAYLKNFWKIINWAIINDRLQGHIK